MSSELFAYTFPLTVISAVITSFILYFSLGKYSKLSKSTRTSISVAFFLIQPLYIKCFIWLYDKVAFSWSKMRLLFWSIFKRNKYERYTREASEIQEEIMKVVNEIGPNIVEKFDENRIIKRKIK